MHKKVQSRSYSSTNSYTFTYNAEETCGFPTAPLFILFSTMAYAQEQI